MKLRSKILAALALTMIATTAIIYFATNVIVLGSFSDLERNQAQQDLDRVEQALAQETSRLDSVSGDWAGWDETYTFVQGDNPEYVEVNLADETFVTLHVDSMLFLDTTGELVFARTVDLAEGTETELAPTATEAVTGNADLWSFTNTSDAVSGIISSQGGPLLVASRPVLTSERAGPIVGALIMLRPLDERLIAELADVTRLALTGYSTADAPRNVARLAPGARVIESQSSDLLSGYTVVGDVNGASAVAFEVEMPRSIYAEGRNTQNYLLIALLVIGLIFTLLVGTMLELTVLRPVQRLSSFLSTVGTTLAGRARVSSNDEMGNLARSTNRMLDSLQRYSTEREALNAQLTEERERIAALNHSLEDTVAQRTADLKAANAELRERNRQLLKAMKQATTDGLTGLLNHRTFQEHIRTSVERDGQDGLLAVLMVDIDGFKQVNDRLGHQGGDRVLNQVADALRRVVGVDMLYRYGGDEFAVCLNVGQREEAVRIGERLRKSVLKATVDAGLTVSIGMSLYPEMATSAEELIYQADSAMYEAKAAGKNRVHVWSTERAPTIAAAYLTSERI